MHLFYSLRKHDSKGAIWPLSTGGPGPSHPSAAAAKDSHYSKSKEDMEEAGDHFKSTTFLVSKTWQMVPCPLGSCHRKFIVIPPQSWDPLQRVPAIWFRGQVLWAFRLILSGRFGNQQSSQAWPWERREMPNKESCKVSVSRTAVKHWERNKYTGQLTKRGNVMTPPWSLSHEEPLSPGQPVRGHVNSTVTRRKRMAWKPAN